jgi:hypothetical protein
MAGLRKPKETRVGVDVAGQVEAVGSNATQFKPGDAVFGSCRGAFAEYVCAAESALVLKPVHLTFEQAAAVPVAGFTALQGLRDKGKIRPGQKVLINGAAGGVGTFAVQIAKALGAEVTGVCSTRNLEMVRSIGADRAMDYTREDFTQSGQRYEPLVPGLQASPESQRNLHRQWRRRAGDQVDDRSSRRHDRWADILALRESEVGRVYCESQPGGSDLPLPDDRGWKDHAGDRPELQVE